MVSLATVEPDGLRILDLNGEGGFGGRLGSRHEAGEEASFKGVAGIVEGRLSDGVVFGEVVKLDLGADGGFKVGRVV